MHYQDLCFVRKLNRPSVDVNVKGFFGDIIKVIKKNLLVVAMKSPLYFTLKL